MKLWIARNKFSTITIYTKRPIYDECTDEWKGYDFEKIEMRKSDFPEVTYENSPQEVELKLVNKL